MVNITNKQGLLCKNYTAACTTVDQFIAGGAASINPKVPQMGIPQIKMYLFNFINKFKQQNQYLQKA
jgi:hypothetical protein